MILNEIFSKSKENYQDDAQDGSQYDLTDTRKTRLTLAHISRLRKMNDMRALEQAKDLQLVQQMYGQPPADAGGGLV